jgi:alpha-tubulin suppressor-like RCC1 family protein
VAVPGGFTFTSLLTHGSATAGLACGITGPGAAYCWGENQYGQLGDGTTTPTTSPVPVLGGLSFTALSSGGRHTCGLTTAGAAYCWGRDSLGQLGDGAPTAYRATPTAVQGGLTFKALAVGYDHTCGLTVAGQMYCWGGNADGQLGDGTTTDRSSPIPVAGGRTFTTVTAANAHSCGITDTGTTFCWGSNAEGELGDGTNISRSAPVLVQGGYVFVDITGGSRSTCGLTTAGQTYCWGLLLVPARNVLFLPFSSPQLVHQPYP